MTNFINIDLTLKNVLIIGHVWPEPKSSAAGSRMLQLIDLFLENHYTITFACANKKRDNAFELNTLGVAEAFIQLNHSSFDDFVSELEPSVVLFDRFMTEEQFGWRVAEHCPKALRVLDTEDLHCLRKGRREAFKDEKPFDQSYLFNDTAKREIASIYRCDLSLIISKAEMQILKDDFKVGESLLHYLPFLLEPITPEAIATLPSFEERSDFVFIGNFLHEPNYDAVLYLKQTIWPLIRKQLPKAKLNIYGAYASQKVIQLHNEREGFLVHGFAEDVNAVMQQAKVCLVPLRFGAGLKGKIFDAIVNGTPCVMTSIAAEGIFDPGSHAMEFISDNPEIFAQKAIELYFNNELFKNAQLSNFKLVNVNFIKQKFNDDFIGKINHLFIDLESHRQQNFFGQLLQHHTLQSTKYLSKWIEGKNG